MKDVFFQDTTYQTAAHLDIQECELLRDYHQKKIAVTQKKITTLVYKADGSLKNQDKIDECRHTLHYHRQSAEKAESIIKYLTTLQSHKHGTY